MKTRPSTEYVLLGCLYSGPMHGYEIIRFLQGSLRSSWYVGTSQLYNVLKRLEKDGLVESCIEHQETRPSKRIFSLTKKGKAVFTSWTQQPSEHVRDMRVEFLAKLYFIRNYDFRWGEKLLEKQHHLLSERKASLMKCSKKGQDPYLRLVCSFKLATVKAWLNWLEVQAKKYLNG